jgi:pimeloyl-ACP methyl ester carboxylesterase
MSRSDALGQVHEVDLPSARIRYRDRGEGPPVVFIAGLLANGDLWRNIVPEVADAGFRCLTPDWPLGAHEIPVPDADLSPPGIAALIAAFLEALELRDVTLVANDTGGAITQIVMANHPERIGRVVLTPSDCFEQFFPPAFAPFPRLVRIPGATWTLVQSVRPRAMQRLPFTFGWVSKRPMPREIVDSFLLPSRGDAAIRRDLRRFLRGVHKRYTLDAAKRLPQFDKPVLLAWAREDRLFPVSLANRLADTLPNATVELIDDSYTFVPEDNPEELVRLVLKFLRAHVTA